MMKKTEQKKEIGRREFIKAGSMAVLSIPFLAANKYDKIQNPEKKKPAEIRPEWRNRQESMAYRQLGRTGFMVSELVFGSERITPDNIRPIEVAIERGVNYLDTAPQYGRGASETAIGKVLNSSSKREKVFLATKLSSFPSFRNNLYREIFNGLQDSKKESIQKRALEMRRNSGIEKPEYFIVYWPGHPRQLDGVFLSDAMMEEYGEKVEGNPGFKKIIINSVEESLKRVGTDYFDILHCPHAATSTTEINNPFIAETFNELKKQGKVRFLGFSAHHNMAALLNSAIDAGYFDVVMLAYNVINYGFLDYVLKRAKENNIGTIAMKAAMAVFTPYPPDQVPVPEWRIQKLNQIIPGDMKLPVKAYLWALQNPDLSAVNSGITTEEMLIENLSVVGRKIDLQPA
jgi:aryl-alcohol dehydrogenase-like predicted oxidoreductase